MAREPETFRVLTPAAASYVFGVSDARLRRLALDGALPFRTLAGTGWQPCRVFRFEDCAARWEPDLDRLGLLLKVSLLQLGRGGAMRWEVYMPRPHVVDGDGELASGMEDS